MVESQTKYKVFCGCESEAEVTMLAVAARGDSSMHPVACAQARYRDNYALRFHLLCSSSSPHYFVASESSPFLPAHPTLYSCFSALARPFSNLAWVLAALAKVFGRALVTTDARVEKSFICT
jgi:hypothetical protein